MYIFGGWIQKPEENGKRTQKAVNDMHLFDLSEWTCAVLGRRPISSATHVSNFPPLVPSNPSADREVWTCMKTKGSAPTPRTGHCCVTFDGCFYIICGGVTNTHPRKSVHKFDPSSVLCLLSSLHGPRSKFPCCVRATLSHEILCFHLHTPTLLGTQAKRLGLELGNCLTVSGARHSSIPSTPKSTCTGDAASGQRSSKKSSCQTSTC